MSAKRRADDDLNHENWDTELKKEIAGQFKKAPSDIIQKRVIRTAKRRGSGSPASFTDTQEPAKNLFSSFGGFKTNSSNTEKDLKSTFSFLKSSPVATNGNQLDLKKDTFINPSLSSVPNNNSTSSSSTANSSASSSSTANGKKYPPKLMRLNKDVADWIKSHVDKDPCCILTPIFRDYERYLKEIENETTDTTDKSDNIAQSSTTSDSAASKAASFSFFKPDSNNTSTSSFLSKPDQASLMVNPFTIKQNKDEESTGSAAKGFSFGVNSQQSSTPSTGFSFGGVKPFTFGNVSAAPASSNAGEKNDGEAEAEESDEPPKPDFKPVMEEDAVYSKRCKVFIKKEAGYADLGVGTLYVKPVAGEKHQLIVRADTSLGNVLINVLLTSGIPLQRMAKNNVMMICVPTPPAPGSTSPPAPSTVLLRVKTSDEADQLLANLEKYRK